jgi:hypothetical protein
MWGLVEVGAALTVLLGIALFSLAETSLVGILCIAFGCYVYILPRFIDPEGTPGS